MTVRVRNVGYSLNLSPMVFLWNHGYCELQQLIQHQGQYILQSSDRGKNQNIIQYLLSDYQPGIYLLEEVLQEDNGSQISQKLSYTGRAFLLTHRLFKHPLSWMLLYLWLKMKDKGFTLWFTGLSGSGKSTLARAVETELKKRNYLVEILDGDVIRTNLSQGLGFSKARSKIVGIESGLNSVFPGCFVTPARSGILAEVTNTRSTNPKVSTVLNRLRPLIFLPAS